MDFISNLPEPILHHIMSMLPDKDAAGTCVLSKSWYLTHSTFPILVFNESRFVKFNDKYNKNNFTTKRKQFYHYVDNTLLQFHIEDLSIQQLKLWLNLNDWIIKSRILPHIDFWIELARQGNVQVLDLTLHGIDNLQLNCIRYCIPSIVAQAKFLVKLSLDGCISLGEKFLSHPIEFSSLKVLNLAHVYFEDKRVFHNLLTSCRCIENINLSSCFGIDSVYIQGLSKLKEVKISGVITEIEIDALSLQSFQFSRGRADISNTIKIDKCTNLKELSLICFNITHQWVLQHYHLFTSIQTLELQYCCMPQRMNFYFPKLKVIKLQNCVRLGNAYIDAARLYQCSFIYCIVSNMLPIVSFVNCSTQLEISVKLSIQGDHFTFDYCKLKKFFLALQCRNISANISLWNIQKDENLLHNSSNHPPLLKHLHLDFLLENEVSFSHVTSLLWSCHPSIITCRLSNRKLIKVLCETLMNGKECFCSSRDIKCWWHDLKDVKITCPSLFDGNEICFDCKTLLEALPPFIRGDATFTFE
ncbi:putative F-box domain, leucine-rich repeat domain, L domain-containing protein [Lupinus albus]|uniref:Putative F-box domain, leucine-rich repeat domain, L domain-containing protein n=1 Tax=Lupinus albus TaxID=3870 RepID=A0A6A4QTH3_LUPAL|nr:putative F-box domain, leucine-rich repeat domain, L domain-containing protein [Lupinus albus]